MASKLIKRTLIGFLLLILAICSVHFVDRMIHCNANGLSRDEALSIANWKLSIQLEKNPDLLKNAKLVSEQLEQDRSWLFNYQSSACSVSIIVDSCGVADVGGLTDGCMNKSELAR